MWSYYRDEIDGIDDMASQGISFVKTKIIGKVLEWPPRHPRPSQLPPNPDGSQLPRPSQPLQPQVLILNVEGALPLKYLSKFWGNLDLSLINCEVELDLSWTKDCVLIKHHNNITGVNFIISSTKWSPVVTLPINNNIKYLGNIKKKIKRTISCNNNTTQKQ